MKIAFPTMEDCGLESHVYSHFGSGEYFIIGDTESDQVTSIINADINHIHGQCQPLAALGSNIPEGVVTGGIGRGALNKLRAAGIKVYRGVEGSVSQNLELIKAGSLPEFSMDHTCAGHSEDGGCSH